MEQNILYYSFNGKLENETTKEEKDISKVSVYEVMKLIGAKPLFFEDHMERFANSIKASGYTADLDWESIKKEIALLTRVNLNKNVNVQLMYIPKDENEFDFMISFIDRVDLSDYERENGVAVETANMERHNPNVKTVGYSYKNKIKSLANFKDTFELLLVNSEGYITEGSKSNIFFSNDGKLITPPSNRVLLGVTRKYILSICEKFNIPVEYRGVAIEEIHKMDGAFLTGTTVDVAPISKINNMPFEKKDELILTLKEEYEEIMKEYLSSEE